MAEEKILQELRKIHEVLDERYKDEFAHREATNKQFKEMMAKFAEIQPVLEVYRIGLSWSTGIMWLTKWFMKVIGAVGIIGGAYLAIKEAIKH